MGFGDYDAAFKMRDLITSIAESVIDRVRPEPRIAQVTNVNRWARKVTLQFPGETDTFDARYGKLVGPQTGDIVKVYSRNGTFWVTEILESALWGAYTADTVLFQPRLGGGVFNNANLGTFIGFDAPGMTVGVGQVYNLGAFQIGNVYSGAMITADVFWNRGFYVSQSQRWRLMIPGDDPDGDVWKVALPTEESGWQSGQGVQLEVKYYNSRVYLRIRRKTDNGATWGGMGYGGMWVYGDQVSRDTSVTWANTVTDTEPTAYVGDYPGGNNENDIASGIYTKGPYYDTERSIVQRRLQQQMTGGGYAWDGANLSWSIPFRCFAGAAADMASGGYIEMQMPANGETVYVHGLPIGTNITVAGGVIPMNSGGITYSALYYDPPLRGTGAYVANRYHLVGTAGRFGVPSHWILVAVMDLNRDDVPDITFGTGSKWDVNPIGWSKQDVCTSASTATTTGVVAVIGWATNLTVPGPGAVYMVDLDVDLLVAAGTTAIVELYLDGSPVAGQIISTVARAALHKRYRLTGLTTGTHALAGRLHNTASSTSSTVNPTHSFMTSLRVS